MIRSALIAALLALTLTACNKPATAPVVEAPAAAPAATTTTTTVGTDAASAVTTTTTTAPAAK